MCERVIIIAKGKLVATDTVENLTSRLHGAQMVAVEVALRDGSTSTPDVFLANVQAKLERVDGVGRVLHQETKDHRTRFTVESLQGREIRPELARAVIESGWNLNELRSVGMSLEEIFLQLTSDQKPAESAPAEPAAEPVHAGETPTMGDAQ
jgi:ABC-2 type transport system ATP-binding protein